MSATSAPSTLPWPPVRTSSTPPSTTSSPLRNDMPSETNNLPPPINHVFVDYENVHTVDPAIIGSKTVHVSLLLGVKSTKFDATVVEKLMRHAAIVEMIRLTSSGRNALDFALAYYVGRAVLADPTGYFHIVSKDKGYDALIEHLRSKHIRARRHDDFTTLTFSAPPPAPANIRPVVTPVAKPPIKPKPPVTVLETLETQVLKYLRKPATNRPGTKKKLTSDLITHLGKKIPETEVLKLIGMMSQAGHLVIDDKGKVTYHLTQA